MAVCIAALLVSATPVFAQDARPPGLPGELVPVVQPFSPAAAPGVLLPVFPSRRSGGAREVLPLYISLVTLNVLDVHSTRKGLATGRAREVNPLLRSSVDNPAAFIAIKAGTTAAAIWMTEKSRKKHRKKAIVSLIVTDIVLAAIVGHNYRTARR